MAKRFNTTFPTVSHYADSACFFVVDGVPRLILGSGSETLHISMPRKLLRELAAGAHDAARELAETPGCEVIAFPAAKAARRQRSRAKGTEVTA